MYITFGEAEQFTTERPDVMAFQLVLGKYIHEMNNIHWNVIIKPILGSIMIAALTCV